MIYMFQDYSLDVERRELRRRMDLVPVEPQVLDLLQYLIRNRDHVVGKDELIAAVWNGRIISESALSSRITAVRHAVGDSGAQQRLIRTCPKEVPLCRRDPRRTGLRRQRLRELRIANDRESNTGAAAPR